MYKRLFVLALTFGMAATAPPLGAATCAPRDSLIVGLETKFQETLKSGGLQKTEGATSIIEFWASEETGTFTVLLSRANGTSCILAAGTDYFEAIPKLANLGTPG